MSNTRIIKNSKVCIVFFSLIFLLSSCAGFFEKDNTPTPTPLKSYHREISPVLLWSKKIGAGSGKNDYLKMSPAIAENAIYTSSKAGTITSINKSNGYKNWETNLKTSITSGPGVGENLVVIGCRNGNIVALNKNTGRQVWTASVPGEIIATPAVGNNVVVVKAVDGYTRGLSTQNGREVWAYQQVEPNLILRGSSSPLIRDNSVLAGYANGSLVKLSLNDGQLLWQQTIAIAQGAFAIQRMIDIDANSIVFDHRIYAATYQGRIAALDWTSGRTIWTHDISSYTGMIADDDAVYISDTRGLIRKFDANSGELNWRQDNLQYRIISGPANMGRYVVVGDGEGYLHWLNKSNGHLAGRASLGSAIYAAPIADNNVLYALTNSGYLAAYTIR